jgi:hypothetical protein
VVKPTGAGGTYLYVRVVAVQRKQVAQREQRKAADVLGCSSFSREKVRRVVPKNAHVALSQVRVERDADLCRVEK